ncbi:MAG: ankyrin repeat domain-containing protein [Candidatus Electryoneaceae bacterium]|nr:ankyrin repeat domain-containing protein [Candidatus Electryoneaceae bacterium]
MTDIFEVILSGSIEELAQLLKSNPSLINATNEIGDTPLHAACDLGNIEKVKLLILKGADVNIVNNWGNTPYQKALLSRNDRLGAMGGKYDHTGVMQLLIEAGANSNITGKSGKVVRDGERESWKGAACIINNLPEDEAAQYLIKAIELGYDVLDQHDAAWSVLGNFYLRTNRMEKAYESFLKVLEYIDSSSSGGLECKALSKLAIICFFHLTNNDKAKEYADKALIKGFTDVNQGELEYLMHYIHGAVIAFRAKDLIAVNGYDEDELDHLINEAVASLEKCITPQGQQYVENYHRALNLLEKHLWKAQKAGKTSEQEEEGGGGCFSLVATFVVVISLILTLIFIL